MKPLRVGGFTFAWGSKTYVMGIMNITPDSFSGDGLLMDTSALAENALAQARTFVAAGADILDIGGESTRPGANPVSAKDEIARVVPVIRAINAEMDTVISVDTSKAAVAQAAIDAGASIINDVWGLRADPEMGHVVAKTGVPVILMDNRLPTKDNALLERLEKNEVGVAYKNVVEDVKQSLLESVALAHRAGIPDKHIILDPGIGFGKNREQNLELIKQLDEIRALGYPILLGPSRKRFIGYTLDLPPDQRVEGTAATVAIGIDRGADIVRVHDVKEIVRTARMTDAIVRR